MNLNGETWARALKIKQKLEASNIQHAQPRIVQPIASL
jgi:hypothetical protein